MKSRVFSRWKGAEGVEQPRLVEEPSELGRTVEHRLAILEVLLGQSCDFQEQKQRWGGAVNDALRSSLEHRDLFAPAFDALHEKIGGGIHGLDRQSQARGQRHELGALSPTVA